MSKLEPAAAGWMMTGSRRFLLLLVLACLTCVVLVQISMDDVTAPRHQYSQEDKGPGSFPDISTNAARKQTTVILTPSTSPTTHPGSVSELIVAKIISKVHLNQTTEPKTVSPAGKIQIEAKVQVRRLPLSKNQQFVSRNDRIKEIISARSVQKRPTLDPMRALKSMAVVDPEKVQRIILLTYFRAGSTFLGDILQQNWRTFYHFEPLHSLTYDERINDTKIPQAFALIDSVLRCNFTNARDYMQWVKKPSNQFLFGRNQFLWVTCHSNPKTCFDPRFVNAACVRSPVHVMKTTRLHMRHLRSYIEDNADLNFKVVYLTRDPRGIVSSRWSLDWCRFSTNCSLAPVLCREMDEDLAIFNELKNNQPSNFIKLRYEDLSLNPEQETRKLFDFLRLPFSPTVKKFLKTHTVSSRKADDKNPYSTRRNSSSMVLGWMERYTYKKVVEVQSQCEDVLHKLNHSLITSPDQLPYPNGKAKTVSIPPNKGRVWRFNKNPIAKKYLSDKKEYGQNLSDYLNNQPMAFVVNNTNIEVHKTYKVLEGFSSKGTSEIVHYPIT